ncbi:Putative beta-lactamase-like 1 [Desmophyllum pertusum]|uniref:Beta-lactamase-like 1 n=1 Tax=Desmophyllum pertusum TaxID=174260 RepID=A0A9W9YCL6_9CNID|nr:Putative beta-lactamase-like 1 [Desmophyllum pertusum]
MDEFAIRLRGKRGNSRRPARLWKTLAVVGSGLTVVMTTLFTWHAVTYTQRDCGSEKVNATGREETRDYRPVSLHIPCPEFPTVVPLSHPLPDQIQHIINKLDSYLSEIVDENTSLPAISANIFHGDSVLWSGHYGSKISNVSRARPDDNTVYRIGSITKIFPVLLIYKLYESGVIDSVDDPLSKYAPDVKVKNPFTNENITLRQIAGQMSGLPREAPCVYHCTQTNSTEQLKLLKNRNLVVAPWATPSYSNLGYALLGRLLTENLLNKTFESWTRKEILDPLGMNNTGFEITSDVEKNMAFPYLKNAEKKPSRAPFAKLGWASPAGEMFSTINDLTKLGMMFTRPWTQKIFKASTIREMSLPIDISPDGRTIWGSPFEMLYSGGFVVRGKAGHIDAYEAFFTFEPRLQLGMNVFISAKGFLKSGVTGVCVLSRRFKPLHRVFSTQTHPTVTLETFEAIAQITVFQNFLRLHYVPPVSFSIKIRHIGLPLTFQASYYYKGISCLDKGSGILADIYFDIPRQDGLSQYFVVPGWNIRGKRIAFDPNYQARVLQREVIQSFFQQPYFLRQY